MFGFVLMFLNSVLLLLIASLVWRDQKLEQVPQWLPQISALAGILILLKPMLLVPARLIVYDETTLPAIVQIRQYRLGAIGGIPDKKRAALNLPEYDASKRVRSGGARMTEFLKLPVDERIKAVYGGNGNGAGSQGQTVGLLEA